MRFLDLDIYSYSIAMSFVKAIIWKSVDSSRTVYREHSREHSSRRVAEPRTKPNSGSKPTTSVLSFGKTPDRVTIDDLNKWEESKKAKSAGVRFAS